MKFRVYKTSEYPCSKGNFLEIANLEELLQFIDEHGEIILSKPQDDEAVASIEIYDDWRE